MQVQNCCYTNKNYIIFISFEDSDLGNKYTEITDSGQQKKQLSLSATLNWCDSSWRSKCLSLNASSSINQNLLNIEK